MSLLHRLLRLLWPRRQRDERHDQEVRQAIEARKREDQPVLDRIERLKQDEEERARLLRLRER